MQLSAARHSCRAYGRYTQSRTVAVRPMHEGRILLNYRRVAVRATEVQVLIASSCTSCYHVCADVAVALRAWYPPLRRMLL